MALSHLGRKMGVPAFRQLASTPRRLASSSSQSSHQGGHNNGARVAADAWAAEFTAECEAVREAFKQERKNKHFVVGTCLTGVGMALLTMWHTHTAYTETQRTKYLRTKYSKMLE